MRGLSVLQVTAVLTDTEMLNSNVEPKKEMLMFSHPQLQGYSTWKGLPVGWCGNCRQVFSHSAEDTLDEARSFASYFSARKTAWWSDVWGLEVSSFLALFIDSSKPSFCWCSHLPWHLKESPSLSPAWQNTLINPFNFYCSYQTKF